MLDNLKSHFRHATPKIIPQWTQYLNSLQIQKEQLRTRFLNNYGGEPRGFRILKQIVDYVDVEYLDKQRNDFDRYINYFLSVRNNAERLFQPVESGRVYRKMFYKKGLFATNEYFCPVDDVDHLSTLPMDKSWEEWEKVQPVHLWYHDTQEYSLNILTGQVAFTYTNPTYALIFVDTLALMFKYYKYISSPTTGEEEKTLHNFIQNHVFKFFFDDLQNTWLLNQILLCCDIADTSRSIKEITSDIQKSNRQYGYIGGRHHEAVEDLINALDDVRDGNVRVNSLLSAKLLPSGSLIDRIHYSFKYLDIAHMQQYKYIRILRDLPLLDLIIKMHLWRPDTETYKSLARNLRFELRRLQTNKPWSRINDSAIREHIQTWLDSTLEKVSI